MLLLFYTISKREFVHIVEKTGRIVKRRFMGQDFLYNEIIGKGSKAEHHANL